MELLCQEILKIVYRLLAAFLLLFLIMSFWVSAPEMPETADAPGVTDGMVKPNVEVPAGPIPAFSTQVGWVTGTMRRLRSAWLHLYEMVGAPPLEEGMLTPYEAQKAIQSIGAIAAGFWGFALVSRWVGRRIINQSRSS